MVKKKGQIKFWMGIILFALVGQIAWTVENLFFNEFVYEMLKDEAGVNPINVIATMVATSALVATLTTLVVGALSDRMGKRKVFIASGYIIWGVSIMAFALINVSNSALVFGATAAAMATASIVIIMDCVMTLFGGIGNEAGYNAWITDITTKENGGIVEGVISIAPLFALLIILSSTLFMDKEVIAHWSWFFLALGILVSLAGVLGFFILEDSPRLKKNDTHFFDTLTYGFRKKTFSKNKPFYIVLAAFLIFAIATEVYLPYLIIYLKEFLELGDDYALVFGIAILFAGIVSIIYGRRIDKRSCQQTLVPAIAIYGVGLLLMALPLVDEIFKNVFFSTAALTILMSGNLMLETNLGTMLREETPKGEVGMFQGIRLIGSRLLPMTIGPFIGSIILHTSFIEYSEDQESILTPSIFIVAALILVVIIIPVSILLKHHAKEHAHEPTEN